MLPEGVENVYLRSDTAGYQHDPLKYCEKGENKRFGRIEFAIGADVSKEFKKAVAEADEWRPFEKMGGSLLCSRRGRLQQKRLGLTVSRNPRALSQPELPGMELPFPAMKMEKKVIRFSLINLPGRIVEHARHLIIRLARNHPSHGSQAEDHEASAIMTARKDRRIKDKTKKRSLRRGAGEIAHKRSLDCVSERDQTNLF